MASDERTPGTRSDEAADIARLIKELQSAGQKSAPRRTATPSPAPIPARPAAWVAGSHGPSRGDSARQTGPWPPPRPVSTALQVHAAGMEMSRVLGWLRDFRLRGAPGPMGPVAVWACVSLGVLLAVSMMFWPYARGCGPGLFCYLTAVGMVHVAGVWGAWHAWVSRVGGAHVLALVTVLWGCSLMAQEVLPRVGYAKASAAWDCSIAYSPRG
jgi:hypothetical protein